MLYYFFRLCINMCSPKKKCKKTQTKSIQRDKTTQTYDSSQPDFLIVHPDEPDMYETDLIIC